jgi:cobalamin synthase
MAAAGPYPRSKGTGKVFIEATKPWEAVLFGLIGCTAAVAMLVRAGMLAALAPFFAALLIVLALARLCLRRLGGITGDCLGTAIESAEFVFIFATVLIESGG